MKNSPYYRSDLAIENTALSNKPPKGVSYTEHEKLGITVTEVVIEDLQGEVLLGKPMGQYITLSLKDGWESEKETEKQLSTLIATTLQRLFPSPKPKKILVVGLGNRRMTADAIGPETTDTLTATGHLPNSLRTEDAPLLFAFSPGVIGKTGMESFDLIEGALAACRADCVIAVDALAASDVSRLAKTVQLADTGIVPGSGVGNHRAALNQESLGVPVIALGVPFVVSSATLVLNALEKGGIEEPSEALLEVLREGQSYFVTPKDCDLVLEVLVKAIARGIENACYTDRS